MQPELRVNPVSVLVVEDDQAIATLLRRNLENENTTVVGAASGLDCMRILHEEKVDLILLDLRLPDFNGWGILSLLRMTDRLQDIPVIVVSVEPPDSALMKLLKPDGYIQKPFDIRELVACVRRVMSMREPVYN